MANEITSSLYVNCTNGDFNETFSKQNQKFDQAVLGGNKIVWTVGTSEESFTATDVATNGHCVLMNLDSTNYVDYGMNDGGTMKALGTIEAGEFAYFRMKSGVTLRAQANTASVKLLVFLLND